MMQLSHKGLIEIMSHESVVLAPYRDSGGVWTWGVGHTAAAGDPDPATLARGVDQPLEMAVRVFERDVKRYARWVNELVTVPLSQHEFDALVDFCYNVGPDIDEDTKVEGLGDSTLLKKLNAGDRAGAAQEFLQWKRPKGIIGRRRSERKLFLEGTYSAGPTVLVLSADKKGRVLWRSGRLVKIEGLTFAKSSPH